MVRRIPAISMPRVIIILIVVAAFFLMLSGNVLAQGLSDQSASSITENKTIEITSTGDAHVTDVLTYDQDWFDQYGSIFKEYPNLLSRRYRNETGVGEIENFDAKVNTNKDTVTITFDRPGFAYNFEANWQVGGEGFEPSKTRDTEVVFEGTGTYENEVSLFQSIPVELKTTIKLPAGATDAKYDSNKGYITYVLPYNEAKAGSFLQNNKSVWLPIFIVLMLLSLMLLLYVILNSRRATVATTGIVAGPGVGMTPPPPVTPISTTYVPPAAPAASTPPAPPVTPMAASPAPPVTPVAAAPAVEQPKMKRFCKHCGNALKESDKKFCSSCGKPLE